MIHEGYMNPLSPLEAPRGTLEEFLLTLIIPLPPESSDEVPHFGLERLLGHLW